jgi:hypothetical protein
LDVDGWAIIEGEATQAYSRIQVAGKSLREVLRDAVSLD